MVLWVSLLVPYGSLTVQSGGLNGSFSAYGAAGRFSRAPSFVDEDILWWGVARRNIGGRRSSSSDGETSMVVEVESLVYESLPLKLDERDEPEAVVEPLASEEWSLPHPEQQFEPMVK